MKPENLAWQKLTTAARKVGDEREVTAPYGFSTRVAAMAMASERMSLAALVDRLSWRALGVAGLLAVASVAASYSSFTAVTDDDVLSNDKAVAALFDAS